MQCLQQHLITCSYMIFYFCKPELLDQNSLHAFVRG